MDIKVMQFRETKIIKTYQKDKFLHSLNRVSAVSLTDCLFSLLKDRFFSLNNPIYKYIDYFCLTMSMTVSHTHFRKATDLVRRCF
jgi:hypothetical protein